MVLKYILLIILAAALAVPLCAQDEIPLRIETDLVNVNVSVADGRGNFIRGLTEENFEVFDNGEKREIEYFSAEDAPVSFGIVYDLHPTTGERTQSVLESLREFTGELGERDDFFTLVFDKRGSLLVDFVPTAEQVATHLAGQYGEPNALYDAIYLAAGKIRQRRNLKRVLLVITDSADHHSEHRFDDVLERLRTLDVQVYTILWDAAEQWEYMDLSRDGRTRTRSDASGLDRAALRELARRTGGELQSPTVQNADALYRIYRQIAAEMNRQYTLGFYPAARDGQWHELKINLRSVGGVRKNVLTYRPGYQSAKAN